MHPLSPRVLINEKQFFFIVALQECHMSWIKLSSDILICSIFLLTYHAEFVWGNIKHVLACFIIVLHRDGTDCYYPSS